MQSPTSCSSPSNLHPPHSFRWRLSTFETRAIPPSLESNLPSSSLPALSNHPLALLPFPCSPFSPTFLLQTRFSRSRMTFFPLFPMVPSQCSIVTPELFVSSLTNFAASLNTFGMALFHAHSGLAF